MSREKEPTFISRNRKFEGGKINEMSIDKADKTMYSANENIRSNPQPCPQKECESPGGLTILRVFIPAGAVINLLGLIELSSPAGICLIIRIPFLGCTNKNSLASMIETIKSAGGSVEFM